MRRLPIFLVIDVSESMVGEPLRQVGNGLRTLVQTLRTDPYALETVYLSVIVFAGRAKTLVPLTDLVSFYPPQLPVGSGTALGAALRHLAQELETKVVKTTAERKGDWQPVIFLFTDGVPTDDAETALHEWAAQHRKRSNLVAVSLGANADLALLRRLTDQVLLFNDADADAYRAFFRWITASIQTQSQKVDAGQDGPLQIAKLDPKVAFQIDLNKTLKLRQDENYVVLKARCQQHKSLYLIKFKRQIANVAPEEWPELLDESDEVSELNEKSGTGRAFKLAGAFPIAAPEDYEELSAASAPVLTVSTADLAGSPACPCCANRYGLCTCACGEIHCLDGPGVSVCPWCGKKGKYGFGEGEADLHRALG